MSMIYKFSISVEGEEEEFLREIEIDGNSTFEDLHYAIIEATGLEGEELASFYICDNMWVKEKEITLLDMSEEENRLDIMSECKIKDNITNPDQKLIYEYDFLNLLTFQIELIKTKSAQAKTKYPRCVKSVGKLTPRAKSQPSMIPSEIEEEFEFADKEFDAFNEDELGEGFDIESTEFDDDIDER
jgi:hypothetical protein